MKKTIILIIILLGVNYCFAQNIVDRKNRITDFVTEKYQTIIQTNKQVKQGIYHAFFGKTVIASGTYANDQKTGTWHYFDPDGKLLENYNYDTGQLTYEAPEDSTSHLRYNVDIVIKDNDIVNKPIRYGGRYFGYVPYLRLFKLPQELLNAQLSDFMVVLELLVSPYGRLADYKIHIKYPNDDKDVLLLNINPDLVPEADKMFIPASVNRQPLASRILVRCYITKFEGIEIY